MNMSNNKTANSKSEEFVVITYPRHGTEKGVLPNPGFQPACTTVLKRNLMVSISL